MPRLITIILLLLMLPCVAGADSVPAHVPGYTLRGPNGPMTLMMDGVVEWEDLLPSLAISPTTGTYPDTAVGSLAYLMFTITNSGNDLAEDVAITVTGAGFSLYSSQTFGNISSGRSKTAKVRFLPVAATAYSGYANYSAPNIGKVSAALTGTGFVPYVPCSAGVLSVNQTAGISSSSLSATAAKGQSFLAAGSGSLYSIKFNVLNKTTNGTILCRFGGSSDLTSSTDTTTVNMTTTGLNEAIFTTHPSITAGNTYFFGCELGTATGVYLSFSNANPYASGSFYTTGTGWSMIASTANDLIFEVDLCN